MQPEALKLLYDAHEAGKLVMQFTQHKTDEQYLQDIFLRSAVERQLFILGEAVSQLGQVEREIFEYLPGARKIVGFRNLLAHGYSAIDDRRVWQMIQCDLPPTLVQIEYLMRKVP